MKIEVEGWQDDVEIDLIKTFIRFSMGRLLSPEDCNSLRVSVRLDMTVLSSGAWADVTAVDSHALYPVDFIVRIARHGMGVQEMLMVMGHEVTHIKQFTTGEWKILNFIQHWWQGQVINNTDYGDWFEPWEIEARGREKGLLELFVKHFHLYTAPWYKPRP